MVVNKNIGTKIIAFPFAGGNKFSFKDYFSNSYNVSILEYPGRGLRIKEKCIENIDDLISDLLSQLKREIVTCHDYIIYGHSMGAIVGFLICQEIEKLNLKKPIRLILSGARPPKFSRKKILSNLNDEDFWSEVTKLGGIPDDLNSHPELVEYFTPILKSDFKCIESFHYKDDTPKLTTPIDAFYGSEEEITKEEADAWHDESTAKVNVTELKGNHFFIFDHMDFFKDYFKSL